MEIKGNGNPLQCSCLENPRDGGARWAAVYGVAQSRTRLKRLSSSSSSELLCAGPPRCHSTAVSDDMVSSPSWDRKGRHTFTRGISVLLTGRLGEATELIICPLFLSCLLHKIILISEQHTPYTSESLRYHHSPLPKVRLGMYNSVCHWDIWGGSIRGGF